MPDRQNSLRAARYARLASAVALLAGTLALIGWAVDAPALFSMRAAWPSLKPNTAIAFILLGVAMQCVTALAHAEETRHAPTLRIAAISAGSALLLLGILTLMEYLLDWQAGFDLAFFTDALLRDAGNHPGRMSPETALSLMLLGTAIVMMSLASRRPWITATALATSLGALTTGLASFTVLATPSLGYESWLGATGMSVQSAVVVSTCGWALFLLHLKRRPGLWVLAANTAHTLGLAIVLMFVTGLTTSRMQHRIGVLGGDIATLETSRTQLHEMLESVVRSQAAMATLLATGDATQRDTIAHARAETDERLAELGASRLKAPAPDHADQLARLRAHVEAQRAWQDSAMRGAHREATPGDRRSVMQRGLALSQLVSTTVAAMESALAEEARASDLERTRVERRAYQVILATTLTGVAVIILVMLGLNRAERTRQYTDAQLRASEFRWKFAIEGAGDGLWDVDLDSGRVFYSRQFKRMLGYDEHEMAETLDEWISRIHPDDRAAAVQAMDSALRDGEGMFHSEHRVHCRDGEWMQVFSRGVIVERHADGAPRRAIGTLTDITARHRMATALADSESRYRNLVEGAEQAIFIHRQGVILFVNRSAVAMMRAESAEALVGTRLLDRVHPESRALVEARVRRSAIDGTPAPLAEERLLRCDGTDLYADVVGSVTVFDGAPAMFASAVDATVRREAEAALRNSEARFHTVFDEAPLGIAVVNSETGEVLEANPRAIALVGWPRDGLIGREWMRTTHPDDLGSNLEMIEMLRSGAIDHYLLDKRFLRPDGSVVWVRLTAARMSAEAGQGARHVAMMQDITQLKSEEAARAKLEIQLQAAQRMESVGRLAGGVAHDFNNMLGVILGTTEMAMRRLKPSDPLLGDLREVQGAARRSADLTRQLLAFARRQVVAPTVLDVNEAVAGSLSMLRRLIGEDVALDWFPGAGLGAVVADATQLDQILTNLVLNARHAMPGVGTITISTENRVIDAAFCAAHPDAVPGEYACLTVRDTGHGMSAEVLAHIFEPFFTTKALGEGTGLGLATVYGAVRQNQGYITVDSVPGHGATFDVYFPRQHATPAKAPRAGGAEVPVTGTERVLVVEDEPTILRMTVRMLESHGYDAYGLTNPREAAALDSARLATFDLLVTDVVMPGINGRELAATLCARSPRLKVLYMSGHPADVMQQHGIVADGVHFVQKPFTTAVIAEKVRETLGDALDA